MQYTYPVNQKIYITTCSVIEFEITCLLLYQTIKLDTNRSKNGNIIIINEFDIMIHINDFFPKVLCNVINEYYNEMIVIDYLIRYSHDIEYTRMSLTINSDAYNFNHNIIFNKHPGLIGDIIVEVPFKSHDIYNDNIKCDTNIRHIIHNFGLFFDYMINEQLFTTDDEQLSYNNLRFIKNNDVVIINKQQNWSDVYYPYAKIIIINEHNLNMCITIHKLIYELLHNVKKKLIL